ncbi:MAG: hypothetical protein E6G92_00305 [Alphaproteobacteria bacterium]|nr:MAG: hypothetical protein E6G92_00305 [Alphaproteobacteria bacterium]
MAVLRKPLHRDGCRAPSAATGLHARRARFRLGRLEACEQNQNFLLSYSPVHAINDSLRLRTWSVANVFPRLFETFANPGYTPPAFRNSPESAPGRELRCRMARARAAPFAQSSVFFLMASANIRTIRGRARGAGKRIADHLLAILNFLNLFCGWSRFFFPMEAETSETSEPAAAVSIDERTGARALSA